jgi:hypothetical protein
MAARLPEGRRGDVLLLRIWERRRVGWRSDVGPFSDPVNTIVSRIAATHIGADNFSVVRSAGTTDLDGEPALDLRAPGNLRARPLAWSPEATASSTATPSVRVSARPGRPGSTVATPGLTLEQARSEAKKAAGDVERGVD